MSGADEEMRENAQKSAWRRHGPFVGALLLDLVGAGVALLVSLPAWQTLTAPRPRPLSDVVVHMSGRDVDSASTALALVALAGVVAVVATRGVWRQLVGGVLVLAGIGLVWRGIRAAGAVDAARARAFVEAHRRTVTLDRESVVHIATRPIWAVLSIACGVLVLVAGALVARYGRRWRAMSARYEAPPTAPAAGATASSDAPPTDVADPNESATPDAAQRAKAAAALWSALDRGEDPTSER